MRLFSFNLFQQSSSDFLARLGQHEIYESLIRDRFLIFIIYQIYEKCTIFVRKLCLESTLLQANLQEAIQTFVIYTVHKAVYIILQVLVTVQILIELFNFLLRFPVVGSTALRHQFFKLFFLLNFLLF